MLLVEMGGWVRGAESTGCRRRSAEDTGAEPCAQSAGGGTLGTLCQAEWLRESARIGAAAAGSAQLTLQAMREGPISRCFWLAQLGLR